MRHTAFTILTIALLAGTATCLTAQSDNRPNIVFILADDLGWKDLGCYGNPFNLTPHLDSLAANGTRYTQAYASAPVCSPTRASIMTGKHPARLHLTNFIAGRRTNAESPLLPADWKPYLESNEVTIAELAKTAGYVTGMVGKWHLGSGDSLAPWNQGFDYTRMIGKNGLDYYNYSIFHDSYQDESFDTGKEYLTDKLTEFGVEFIRQNKQHPFFLYLAYSAPHVTLVPRPDKLYKYFRKYDQYGGKYDVNYAAMVESLDDGVGSIMRTLEEEDLLENTLVIFTSDNGGLGMAELGPPPTSNEPLRKWKGHLYEGGVRVPAIVSWKGTIPARVTSDTYFMSVDYLPTFCELIGITTPHDVDGLSILPLILNAQDGASSQRPIYWHYPHFSNQMSFPAAAVRAGDYKLIQFYETRKLELYNIRDDISELRDLSGTMKSKTRELHSLLTTWLRKVDANMPLSNPDYKIK